MEKIYLAICLTLFLFSACRKEDQKPLPAQNQNSVDIPKNTGKLIVKINVDPQKWNATDYQSLFLTKLSGSTDNIVLIRNMEVENQTTYDLGEWNPGEYKIEVQGDEWLVTYTSWLTNVFQIKSGKTTEFIVD